MILAHASGISLTESQTLPLIRPSCEANRKQYSGNFDATVKYLMNQVSHQQVNQPLHIGSVGSVTTCCLKTPNDCGQDLEMPLIEYLPEDWAQLLSAQKSSICKH